MVQVFQKPVTETLEFQELLELKFVHGLVITNDSYYSFEIGFDIVYIIRFQIKKN